MPAATATAGSRRRYDAAAVRRFIAAVLQSHGVAAEDAAIAATVINDADRSGIESHGIAHFAAHPHYERGLRDGTIAARPDIRTLRESSVTAAWDSGSGLGSVVAHRAMQAAIDKASAHGIGMVSVKDGRHFGANGYYARMAAERDMIGMCVSNAPAFALPPGGLDRVCGTNPIAMAAPGESSHPFVIDVSTTTVSGGKLAIARRQGKPIPHGWAVNGDGSPSTDPSIIYNGGHLLPLGAGQVGAEHKGYGLSLMVDILGGVLSGTGSGMFIQMAGMRQGQWFAAWRIDAFVDVGEFKREMRKLVDAIHASRPLRAGEVIRVPGDASAAARIANERDGIPLEAETIAQCEEIARRTGVAFPAPKAAA
jgi:L-2-hydroxycarboxylate dehydrogenase (NAD+)